MDDATERNDDELSEEEKQRQSLQDQFFSGTLDATAPTQSGEVPETPVDPQVQEAAATPSQTPEISDRPSPAAAPPPALSEILKGQPESRPSFLHRFFSVVIGIFNLLIIIALVILIRIFVVSPFSVEGSSMEENFADGDLILVDKLSYALSEPQRGDVIVFHPPQPYTDQRGLLCEAKKLIWPVIGLDIRSACRTRVYFVKRVVGVPGDTVRIENGKVFVTPQGGTPKQIREDFLSEKNRNRTCFDNINCNSEQDIRGMEMEVPEGAVFVLGDNRTGSSDSREWRMQGKATPFVPFNDISGRVRLIFWPFSDFGVVNGINLLSTPAAL